MVILGHSARFNVLKIAQCSEYPGGVRTWAAWARQRPGVGHGPRSFATRQQPSGEPASFKRHLGLPPLGAIEFAVLLDKASADQVVGATPAHSR